MSHQKKQSHTYLNNIYTLRYLIENRGHSLQGKQLNNTLSIITAYHGDSKVCHDKSIGLTK